MTLRIEKVKIDGDSYYRAEEGTKTEQFVSKLNRIGDLAHQEDELIPTSSSFARVAAKVIDSNSIFGNILRKFFSVIGCDPSVRICLLSTWKKEWEADERQRELDNQENRLYIEQLRISRGPK